MATSKRHIRITQEIIEWLVRKAVVKKKEKVFTVKKEMLNRAIMIKAGYDKRTRETYTNALTELGIITLSRNSDSYKVDLDIFLEYYDGEIQEFFDIPRKKAKSVKKK